MSETDESVPFVSVIVPVFNGAGTIGDCLASLLRMDYPAGRIEIIAVDNGSTDETSSIIRRHPVHYLCEGIRGAPHAMNRGIASSSGEIVAFTDADCVVTTGWARELVSSFRDEQAWAVAGEVFPYPPATPAERYLATHFGSWQERQLNSYRPFALTANVAFRRATFARIGVFGTDIGVSYDKEFSWRLLEQALEIHYNPAAAVFYRHRSSAWGLLRQQISWGHGAALVRAKFDLPGTISDEPRSAMKTGQSVAQLALAFLTLTPREWKGNRRHLHDAYFEVLRRTGFHVGALTGTMAGLQPRASKASDLATTHARAAIDAQMED